MIERRLDQLRAEGVRIECGVEVGTDITGEQLRAELDAVVLTDRFARAARPAGSGPRARRHPQRDGLPVHAHSRDRAGPGRDTRPLPSVDPPEPVEITAAGQARRRHRRRRHRRRPRLATSLRQGASITQLELLPEPPATRPDDRTRGCSGRPVPPSYAMEEAQVAGKGEQDYPSLRRAFQGENGVVKPTLRAGRPAPPSVRSRAPTAVEGRSVLLAMGFSILSTRRIVDQLHVDLDRRGNIKAPTCETSVPGVFAAGDARCASRRSLGDQRGRQAARMVERYWAASMVLEELARIAGTPAGVVQSAAG